MKKWGHFTLCVSLTFDLHRDLKVDIAPEWIFSNAHAQTPWVPCERLEDLPLVRGNTLLDLNMDLHLLEGACSHADKTPIDKSVIALDNLVCQALPSTHRYHSFFI